MKLPRIKLPFSQKTLNIIVLILGVLLLAALVYYSCADREGFEGSVPTASQTSAIPSDTAGATTSDPTIAKPQTKDIQSTLDELDTLLALASLKQQLPESVMYFVRNKDTIQNDLNAALSNPEQSTLTLDNVTQLRAKITDAMKSINNTQQQQEQQQPKSYETTVVAGTPGIITLKELENLVQRIDEEKLRLANLRSSSATLLARQTQLEKLAADIREMIISIERGAMKLEDVPISPASADAFLKSIQDTNSSLTFIQPPSSVGSANHAPAKPDVDMTQLYGLLENAKYLKWELGVKLEYDPRLAARDNVVKRLEAIEKRLSDLAISETPINKDMYNVFMKELNVIHGLVQNDNGVSNPKVATPQHPEPVYTRLQPSSNDAEFPSSILTNEDAMIRPGFIMNDDTIQRRASASAFDDSIVGGLDYKKRAMDLCRQIRGANLGEPVQFGCILNPDEVSPEYSWKGNFLMVCNRLGNTWGGWYPEMFGCPKYDPTQKFKATMM